jgi:hypothetical protein
MGQFLLREGLDFQDRLFIAMVKLAEKEKDLNFFKKGIVELGGYLGIDYECCKIIQERYKRRFRMSTKVICVGCKRVVKLGSYHIQGEYRCAKCRGIEVPKKQKERTYEEKGLYIR